MIKGNLRSEGHLKFIWRGHDQEDIFVSVCQSELYTVSHYLKYDRLTPNIEKPGENKTCTLENLLNDQLECLDIFVMDIIHTHMNTTDLHATEKETRFHIPALFGDDFAYSNASHNFIFINKLGELL